MLLGRNGRTLICTAAILSSAVLVCADGAYQRTKDGRTLIWNEQPRAGDVATWSGDRDAEGYATGFGTLTWYKTQPGGTERKQSRNAYYFGNMIRGQFNGPVNSHARGSTSHAVFSQGRQMSRWTAGPVTSWATPRSRSATLASENRSNRANVESASQDLKSKPPQLPSKSEDAQTASNPAPKSYTRATSRPMPNYDEIRDQAKAQPDAPAEGPPASKPAVNPTPVVEPKTQSELDDSLRELIGPPPALGSTEKASRESQPNFSKGSHLSKSEVIDLSDAEARKRGYDLSRYERPNPQFDPVDNTWSLFYAGKAGSGGPAKRFTVAIDDKTKRTAVVPAR